MNEDSERTETFSWQECAERLDELFAQQTMIASSTGKYFVSADTVEGKPKVEFYVPPCMPISSAMLDPITYRSQLSDELGDHLVILIQAGAASLGWWSDDELIYHKVIKAYVVRGKGRSQILHAKTKGKSRYGSRLRLRNAQQHLVDINEKIHNWWDEQGAADHIFYSCPQRSWPELFAVRPTPPFEQRDKRLIKIPLHVHVPNFEELLRVRRKLLRGRVVYRYSSAER